MAQTPRPPQPPGPFSFNEVLVEELRRLRPEAEAFRKHRPAPIADPSDPHRNKGERGRDLAALYREIDALGGPKDARPLSAICLSGGGIRSATFNLGVLQGLARAGLLDRFDYLSSVSGGGYIAGWLKAWTQRRGTRAVVDELRQGRPVSPLDPEPNPIDRLREYSNYLTPRRGLFSLDTWTAAAVVLRNLLLNWLVIVPVIAAAIMLVQFALLVVQSDLPRGDSRTVLLGLAMLSALVASVNLHRYRHPWGQKGTPARRIVLGGFLPLLGSAALLAAGLAWTDLSAVPALHVIVFALLWGVLLPLAGWAVHEPFWRSSEEGCWPVRELLALVGSGGLATGVLVALAYSLHPYLLQRPALYVVFSLPVLLLVYLLGRSLFVAFAGVGARETTRPAPGGRDDADREWWARLSGLVLLTAVGWVALSGVALLGWLLAFQMAEEFLPHLLATVGGVAGVLVGLLGKSPDTGETEGAGPASPVKDWALKAAAPVFCIALVVLLAHATVLLGRALTGEPQLFSATGSLLRDGVVLLGDDLLRFLAGPAALLAFSVLMGWVVNVNRFSLHGFYRNRLVRAFVGASNHARSPDPFTGFDFTDNLKLHALWREPGDGDRPECRQPMLVVNTTLNLVTGQDKLAWQQRKAESFSMTPLFCGNFYQGYRRSEEYGGPGGITLGTALTISGAAANPNSGQHSSPALTFLMTLANARLGAWLGNTSIHGDRTYRRSGPRWAVRPLVAELFGLTHARSPYVNLSDGGHFDNLGLYEMVLRRCRLIFVSDAGCDPRAGFIDLGNAIRKVRIDFGVSIEFTDKIRILPRDELPTGLYCATAAIRYSDVDGPDAGDGMLIYIKPALYGRGDPLPYDIHSYAQGSERFPHEPTHDQWFSESQFESYRALGQHAFAQLARELDQMEPRHEERSLPHLVAAIQRYVSTAGERVVHVPRILTDVQR